MGYLGYCCKNFKESRCRGTDNEGFSQAIIEDGTGYKIGLIREPITFCPWCGFNLVDSAHNIKVEEKKIE